MMDLLKLVALDGDDMEVVSTHLQDAVVKAADIHWRPAENRVVVGLNRFDWEAANGAAHQFRRRRAALRFDRVLACKCRNLDAVQKDQVLNLLAVAFSAKGEPAGTVTLTFSGGGVLRLDVECLEAELADLGPCWSTDCCPEHAIDAVPAEASDQAPIRLAKQG
ncbi:MAG: DUF2948 family protein [Xanthobacteraceae bacterium]|nr:DUF2948 family protein [Xanthobacteraceae bacterium]